MEVDRLRREWDVDVEWAPYFLDPSIPPEGRARTPQTSADTPKSYLEERGESLGIEFRRGRTFTPNSHLALQAAEFARRFGTEDQQWALHYALFRAFFTDLENIGDIDVLVRLGAGVGLDAEMLREALSTEAYREQVDQGIEHSYAIGVTGIPTFVLDGQYAIVGAQDYDVFEKVMVRLGVPRRDGTPPPEAAASDLDDFD